MATKTKILALDDERVVLRTIEAILAGSHDVCCCQTPYEAEAFLERFAPELLLLDLNLGNFQGLEWLERWRRKFPRIGIVVVSAESNLAKAVECMKLGALDYLQKPFRAEDLSLVVHRALEKQSMRTRTGHCSNIAPQTFIGESAAAKEILTQMHALKGAAHLNVLLWGETGTGKELIARLLHAQESDMDRPFVVVNTPALPDTLVESELFGSEAGAYTDSKKSRPGKLELANGGDLFLDEIGDMRVGAQAKILRAIQEKSIERLGGNKSTSVRFRVISATNRSIHDLVSKGELREDLFFRLADFVLFLPPLRERKEDILPLANYFLRKHCAKDTHRYFSERAVDCLQNYVWPGNIRQLESTIKRALVVNPKNQVDNIPLVDASTWTNPNAAAHPFEAQVRQFERRLLEQAVERSAGNRTEARKLLGLSNATFYRKLQQHGIS